MASFVLLNDLVLLLLQLTTVPQNVALTILLFDRFLVLVVTLTWCVSGYLQHCYIFHWVWVTEASDTKQVMICRAVPVAISATLVGCEVGVKYLRHGSNLSLSYPVSPYVTLYFICMYSTRGIHTDILYIGRDNGTLRYLSCHYPCFSSSVTPLPQHIEGNESQRSKKAFVDFFGSRSH